MSSYPQTSAERLETRALIELYAEFLRYDYGEFSLIDLPSNRILLKPLGPPEEENDYEEGQVFVCYVEEDRLILDDYIREFHDDPELRKQMGL